MMNPKQSKSPEGKANMIGWLICKVTGEHDFAKIGDPHPSSRYEGVLETPIKCGRCGTLWHELSVPNSEEK